MVAILIREGLSRRENSDRIKRAKSVVIKENRRFRMTENFDDRPISWGPGCTSAEVEYIMRLI